MIASLSDEASGDLADANLHSPYKSETNGAEDTSCEGPRARRSWDVSDDRGGGLVAHLPPSEA
jgi:hypothetical protein